MDSAHKVWTDEFLTISPSDTKKVDKFLVRLDEYLVSNPDLRLSVISLLFKVFKANNKNEKFDKCCDLATPIFEYLEKAKPHEYIDFYILSMVIGYMADYNKTLKLFQEAANKLDEDEYLNNPKYNSIRRNLRYNMMFRTLRASFFDADMDKKALEAVFMSCYDYVMEVCERKCLPRKHVLEARLALFQRNVSKLQFAMDELRDGKSKDKHLYAVTRDEIAEYLPSMNQSLGTKLMNILIGFNVRKYREALGWTQTKLAEKIGMEQGAISSIECGKHGVSSDTLKLLAHALGIEVSNLMEGCPTPKWDEMETFLATTRALVEGTNAEEKAAILKMLESFLAISRAGKDTA